MCKFSASIIKEIYTIKINLYIKNAPLLNSLYSKYKNLK